MKLKTLSAALLAATSLSAFALTPGSGTWVKESATYGTPNLQDAYVYVPSNASPATIGSGRALMITLHGCGQTASGNVIAAKFNWVTTAEQYGMVVVAPTVPSGTSSTRSSSGCWDWFGANHNRTSRDAVPLKKLVDAVMARSDLNIDPKQIYITGLSSGAGETHVIGCSFPEIFAGIGENAGPALGSASTDIFADPKITATQVANNCKAMNGNNATYNAAYNTQIYNTIYGSSDAMVKPSHNVRNAEGMKVLYGMSSATAENFSVTGSGVGKQYRDANGKLRVSDISVTGMAHAWPAGSGGSGGGTYVDYSHVNYPAWVTDWFFMNNLRVTGGSTTTTTTTTPTTATTSTPTTATTATPTTATTAAPTTTTVGACFKASNYAQVTAGRAHQSLGTVYANGSNQNMGLYNTYAITKLRQTGANYYVIDSSCP